MLAPWHCHAVQLKKQNNVRVFQYAPAACSRACQNKLALYTWHDRATTHVHRGRRCASLLLGAAAAAHDPGSSNLAEHMAHAGAVATPCCTCPATVAAAAADSCACRQQAGIAHRAGWRWPRHAVHTLQVLLPLMLLMILAAVCCCCC
jgi:hypothetical protein